MRDRNKSELTHRVTDAAELYLAVRGCKPIAPEVFIPSNLRKASEVTTGWIADLAALLNPTQTECIMLKLIGRRPEYKNTERILEWQRKLETMQRLSAVIVEVKTSRSDFNCDWKWNQAIPATMAYLAIPAGIIKQVEWPDGWGILEYIEGRQCVICRRPPTIQVPIDDSMMKWFIYAVAIRKENILQYADNKASEQTNRIEENQSVTRARVIDCMRAVRSIVKGSNTFGTTVEEVFAYFKITLKDDWLMNDLRQLWGLAKAGEPSE